VFAARRLEVLEYLEVEFCVVDRHRDVVGDLEPQGRPEVLLVEEREVDLANHHALVGDADDRFLRSELRPLPELRDRLGDHALVAHLTVDDGLRGKRDLAEADQRQAGTTGRHERSSNRARPDIESYDARLTQRHQSSSST
jgi:hypothetical protein